MHSELSTSNGTPLRVYFDNVNFSSNTGPNSFASRLANILVETGKIQVVPATDDYDTFFCFIEPTVQPNPKSNFVHRLDGIWFKPEQFKTHNARIKWAYNNCDTVIWQSEFDRGMTTKWWGERSGSVIHNGISLNAAKPTEKVALLKEQYKKVFVCSANWHRQKRLKENIEFFQAVGSEKDCLVVMGARPDVVSDDPRVLYTGPVRHDVCLEIYAIADWMIHLAWLDHCPNVVVEALSQGCPIICTDSGGTKEIVGKNGLIIKEREPYNFELLDYDCPPPLDLQHHSLPNVFVDARHLDIRSVALKYYEQLAKQKDLDV